MSKLRESKLVSVVVSVLTAVFGVAILTYAATTISTNVNTAGTLNADSATTLNGNVTLGDAIGDLIVLTGNASTTNALYVTNAFTVGGNSTTTAAGAHSMVGALTVNGNVTLGDSAAADTLTINAGVGGHVITASSTVVGSFTVTGQVNASSTLVVDGATTLNGSTTIGDAIGDNITIAGNATTTNSFFVGGTASTTRLSVGGGAVFSSIIGGFCNIPTRTISASSSAGALCTDNAAAATPAAKNVLTGDRVFVMATGSLPANFTIIAASSTASNGQIGVMIRNDNSILGNEAVTATGAISFNFWAFR